MIISKIYSNIITNRTLLKLFETDERKFTMSFVYCILLSEFQAHIMS